MRTIKFRAWDESKMYNVTTLGLNSDGVYLGMSFAHGTNNEELAKFKGEDSCHQFTRKAMLMQFTGLLDKNGKEIYEGDKVFDGLGIHRVFWDEEDCAFNLIASDNDVSSIGDWGGLEVIGNIHENPELLTK